MEHIMAKRLAEHLLIDFYDCSNRYFGNFHKVRILVKAQFLPGPDCGPEQEVIVYEKTLEQMGVATAAVPAARQRLIDTFMKNTAAYLLKQNFADKYRQHKNVFSYAPYSS